MKNLNNDGNVVFEEDVVNVVVVDGVRYYQPDCHCDEGGGHICYLRLMPQTVNISINEIIKANS